MPLPERIPRGARIVMIRGMYSGIMGQQPYRGIVLDSGLDAVGDPWYSVLLHGLITPLSCRDFHIQRDHGHTETSE